MFYLKNDDMEELFRKAAENYELDTSKASNWEDMHKKLHENTPGSGNDTDAKKGKKRRFIFWWFLLFPAGWIAHNTWQQRISVRSMNNEIINVQQNVTGNKQELQETHYAGKPESTVKAAAAVKQQEKEKVNVIQNGKLALLVTRKTTGAGNKIVDAGRKSESVKYKGNNIRSKNADKLLENFGVRNSTGRYSYDYIKKRKGVSEIKDKPVSALNTTAQAVLATMQTVETDIIAPGAVDDNNYVMKFFKTEEELNKKKEDTGLLKPVIRIPRQKDNYFYAQLMVAPDLTAVKFQRFSGTGSSIGILAGYRINRRLHIEAGAYWEKKLYYTEGKYFDKSKLGPYWTNADILSADGNCRMITIPLNIRYNISDNAKRDWFVAAGSSSYLMNREYYDLSYMYNGQQRDRGYESKEASQSWMTVINLSAGYERKIWKSYQFRVEPYYRLPLAGVGKGSLSLNSAGIYIGIGRRF